MAGCLVHYRVLLPDGSPASFATMTVYEVVRVLWWEVDRWVASRTADFNGNVSIDLTYNKKYHFVFRHVTRRADLWRTLTYCPYYAGAQFPY